MASKVIVKIPVAPFSQVNKAKSNNVNSSDVMTITRSSELNSRNTEQNRGPDATRIAQLEQNLRFLQEQHQLMLTGLHHEIDSLRHRNRELQFQLVFAKGSVPSSPSSSEDDTKHKVYTSPKQVNVTPLQVELLERELGELKVHLQEIESRNMYLSAIVDEQKKKLERYERDRERERERSMQPDPELLRKLEDAETLIRRLHRENSDLKRESSAPNMTHSASFSYQQKDGNYHSRENNGSYQSQKNGANQGRSNGRNRSNNGHFRGNWFPPLHSQSYWQGGRGADRNNSTVVAPDSNSSLPSLQVSGGAHSSQYQSRRGSNNNHYHSGEGRKFRSGNNRGGNKPS